MIELNPNLRLVFKIGNMIRTSMSPYRFGFVQGHPYLKDEHLRQIKKTLFSDIAFQQEITFAYEKKIASIIGPGLGISYAAGRMAFYSILRSLNIGLGDEVILLGFTCSVMANAVWRIGATPVFADVDEVTFGSIAESIEKKITPHTKVIVAQHSFGIPCKIKEIVELGRRKGIFVIEDCAITFDSSIDGTKVGNFGDAAIFSTDHSKPLNTLIGGFLYTNDEKLYKKVISFSKSSPQLKREHQQRLFDQLLFEEKYYTPENYPRLVFFNVWRTLAKRLWTEKKITFLEEDYIRPTDNIYSSVYPYPSKMPAFLAQLGLMEIERWEDIKKSRKNILRRYLEIAQNSSIKNYIPKIYFDSSVDICPLRFAYCHPHASNHLKKMFRYIETDGTWFKTPVICCANGLQDIGYTSGDCKISEHVGHNIVNWPCNIDEQWEDKLLQFFQSVVSE
ncbi:MAG: DegT/DnrJ/EryC1/StrS family aminotransferase [Pseudomonadota bacterium]